MPVPYQTLNFTKSMDLYNLFGFSNDVSGGIFMPMMLLVIWVIAFVGSLAEGRQASRGFIFASFICSVLAIILALIGFLNTQYMYFTFLLVGIGLIWDKLNNAIGI